MCGCHDSALVLKFKTLLDERTHAAQGPIRRVLTRTPAQEAEAATDLSPWDRSMSDLSIEMRVVPSWFSLSRLC